MLSFLPSLCTEACSQAIPRTEGTYAYWRIGNLMLPPRCMAAWPDTNEIPNLHNTCNVNSIQIAVDRKVSHVRRLSMPRHTARPPDHGTPENGERLHSRGRSSCHNNRSRGDRLRVRTRRDHGPRACRRYQQRRRCRSRRSTRRRGITLIGASSFRRRGPVGQVTATFLRG